MDVGGMAMSPDPVLHGLTTVRTVCDVAFHAFRPPSSIFRTVTAQFTG
jgi:hypothetical protein